MRRHLQQGRRQLVAAGLSLLATAVYLLTLDRSASWWDCGEFIATGWLLQVGHPPGAPLYTLLSHLCMLLSFDNPMWVAPLSNALSAVCGGLTVGILFLTLGQLGAGRRGAAIGALCYLFCDTVWFSAVESEVYSMAMLFCALDVWLALRWRQSRNPRLWLLIALLLGLGVCVHLMTLLTMPALLLIGLCSKPRKWLRTLPLAALFFLLGLTPYLSVPIRASANPPINEGNPSTAQAFASYLSRDQYAKAPLYPRMWRDRDRENCRAWSLGAEGLAGNAIYYVNYQLGYMYGRYLMNNFIGRQNHKNHRTVVFVVPFLLGLLGLLRHRRRDKTGFRTVLLLFLFGGVLLNLYLNHPCYEPRDRDYAYVLSFYAFALWVGIGADELLRLGARQGEAGRRWAAPALTLVALLAPASLALGNWSDHDRHDCHSVHDISLNHLQSCDPNSVLITLGDNDTFPLWYLQQVENRRTDIDIYNINLTGFSATTAIINRELGRRPVYLSQYMVDRYGHLFGGCLRCEGFCWRIVSSPAEAADTTPLHRHLQDSIRWNITQHEYLDDVSESFLETWKANTGNSVR